MSVQPRQYRVRPGDTFPKISSKVYGDSSLWPEISRANPSSYRGGSPVVGDILLIPPRHDLTPETIQGNSPDDCRLIVGGLDLPYQAIRIKRTMDTVADGWTATVPWTRGENPDRDAVLRPFAYPSASVYIGGQLLVSGYVGGVVPRSGEEGISKGLEGWSYTADALDSHVLPPYEVTNVSALTRANQYSRLLGLSVDVDPWVDLGGPFEKLTADPSDKIAEHLTRVLSQRGALLSSTPKGNFLITKADLRSPPVGELTDQDGVIEARFNGRARYRYYKALTQQPFADASSAIATDQNVPRSRFIVFRAEDSTSGDLQRAADWKMSKQVNEALEVVMAVDGWFAPNGKLWAPNTRVSLKSDLLDLPNGFVFLIRATEHTLDHLSARRTVLNLTLPQVYTGEIPEDPWA